MTTPYGTYLRQRRTGIGLSRTRLAQAAGVTGQSIRDWEAGKREPHPSNRERIDEALTRFEDEIMQHLATRRPFPQTP